MTAFVEECCQEWKRLGVPDVIAEEMATELETDLAEAEADGVPAAELLGETDAPRFAAAWATERGLVADPPPKNRRRLWIGLAAGAVLLVVALSTLALVRVDNSASANVVKVPEFLGVKACDAVRIAHVAGLTVVHTEYKGLCNAQVISQKPAAGRYVALHTPTTLRLNRARIPHLVGLKVCDARRVATRVGIVIMDVPKSSRCMNFVVKQTPAGGQIVDAPVFMTIQPSRIRS